MNQKDVRRGRVRADEALCREVGLDGLEARAEEAGAKVNRLGRGLADSVSVTASDYSKNLASAGLLAPKDYAFLQGIDNASIRGPNGEATVELDYSGYKPLGFWSRVANVFFELKPRTVSLGIFVQHGTKRDKIANVSATVPKTDEFLEQEAAVYLRQAVDRARSLVYDGEEHNPDREKLFEQELVSRAAKLIGSPRLHYAYEVVELRGSLEACVKEGEVGVREAVDRAVAGVQERANILTSELDAVRKEIAARRVGVDSVLKEYRARKTEEIDATVLKGANEKLEKAEERLGVLNREIARRKFESARPFESVLAQVDSLFEDYDPAGTKDDVNHEVRTGWARRIYDLGMSEDIPLTPDKIMDILRVTTESLRLSGRKYTRTDGNRIMEFVEAAVRRLPVSFVDSALSRIRQVGEARGSGVEELYGVLSSWPGSGE